MAKDQINPYLKTRVMTASPQELRLMLYEGAIKFCRQGQHALEHKNYEDMYNALTRAQKIILELDNSLNHQHDPELCERLSAIYNFLYRRLVDINLERDTKIFTEVIELLEYEHETWKMLMKQLEGENIQASQLQPEDLQSQTNTKPLPQAQTKASPFPSDTNLSQQSSFSIKG